MISFIINLITKIKLYLRHRLVEGAHVADDADEMDAFEQDYGNAKEEKRHLWSKRHDHPSQAGQDECFESQGGGDGDQHRQGDQHDSPY